MVEFNLSEKMIHNSNYEEDDNVFFKKDVKEFIRRLKEETWKEPNDEDNIHNIWKVRLHEIIDKLAGDKLK